MTPDPRLEQAEENALAAVDSSEFQNEAIDVTDLTEEELIALGLNEGEELPDTTDEEQEQFIKDTQRQWAIDHGVIERPSMPGLPQAGESLDDFIERKEEAFREGEKEEEVEESETPAEAPKKFNIRIGGKSI